MNSIKLLYPGSLLGGSLAQTGIRIAVGREPMTLRGTVLLYSHPARFLSGTPAIFLIKTAY